MPRSRARRSAQDSPEVVAAVGVAPDDEPAPARRDARLQRREFYRLQVPLAHALSCLLRAEDLARKPVEVSARVIDIGAGGVAVMVPAGAAEFVIGGVLPACRLALPDGDPIELDLEVRNLNRQTQRNGTEQLRVGLRFAALPRTADTRIQRYIFKTERELNAKARGGI